MTITSTIRLLATAMAAGTYLHAAPQPLHLSDGLSGSVRAYVVRPGDSLTTIGARAGIDNGVLAAANGLGARTALVAGESLTIDNRHIAPAAPDTGVAMVINVPQRMLFLLRDGAPRQGFPIAVGRSDWRTPIGPFRVIAREEHPTWDVPVSIQQEMRRAGQRVITRMPPGPRNPLGDYWVGLSFGSLGIHGTPYPSTIYRFTTHGCLRMHPDDIKALYGELTVGTPGVIVYEPVLLAAAAGAIFLEAHRDAYRRGDVVLDDVRSAATAAGIAAHIDWTAAADVLRRRDGVARQVSFD